MAEEPPSPIRDFFKYVQETDIETLSQRAEYVDFHAAMDRRPSSQLLKYSGQKTSQLQNRYPEVQELFFDFGKRCGHCPDTRKHVHSVQGSAVFEVEGFPGLYIYEHLFKANPGVCLDLVDEALHDELANPANTTNVHQDYHVNYPAAKDDGYFRSFFDTTAARLQMLPRLDDSWCTSPITVKDFVDKLRWIKPGDAAAVSPRIKALFGGLFEFDVRYMETRISTSHETQRLRKDLAGSTVALNISHGCHGVMVVGLPVEPTTNESVDPSLSQAAYKTVAIRLQPTDALVFTGASKQAWYGTAKVLPGTFPFFEDEWPCWGRKAANLDQQDWKGSMKGRHIDIIIR